MRTQAAWVTGWRAIAASLFLALAACAQMPVRSALSARVPAAPTTRPPLITTHSDVPLDADWRISELPNGLRIVLRRNNNPADTVLVRMEVGAGSLDEREDERGYAHFIEHMAFQGSTHVPPGEMVHLLERQGLAFGADTNASTDFERTIYKLDLPRADPTLVDTALMLMRETAGELLFDPDRLTHERGVVLAEKRDRNSFAYRNLLDQLAFIDPAARYAQRMPIGTQIALDAATSPRLRNFWARTYVPGRTTLIVIGDIDPAAVAAAIAARFGDWHGALPPPQPTPGPVLFADAGRTDIYLDPAVAERIIISRHGPYQDEPDSFANRRTALLKAIGYGIVNRRLQHVARRPSPPFRDAGFGTGDTFKAGRTTNLLIDEIDGGWKPAITAAAQVLRRALADGFNQAEVAEQLAGVRTSVTHAAAAAATRSNGALMGEAFELIDKDVVPAPPATDLAWFTEFAPKITPAMVLAALKAETVPLIHPLIRLQGRRAPVGIAGATTPKAGEAALRTAWDKAMRGALPAVETTGNGGFGYNDFGPAGTVVADAREPLLGIREVRFANEVRLNLKHTDLERDKVLVSLALDGGRMLVTRSNPLAVAMTSHFIAGGLGKHSQDELQTLLAGHAVGVGFGANPQTFNANAATTPADLGLQLQLMAAEITDPGYRLEGENEFRVTANNMFAALRSTPGSALTASEGGILSDSDPRFTLPPVEAFRALTFAKLRQDIADRLAHGAIEIGIVGDVDEDAAIALVARTFGALAPREPDFLPYLEQRHRPFTTDHSPRSIEHTGPADQALIRVVWATRDDSDAQAKQVLNLLSGIVQLDLTEALRQKLGKAYSPSVSSAPTREWVGYGTFSILASVDVRDIAATRAAIAATIAAVRDAPADADTLLRARAPLAQSFDNALKTNGGWISNVDRAQSEPDRIERQVKAHDRLLAVTAADVQAAARQYLTIAGAVEIAVLPQATSSSH